MLSQQSGAYSRYYSCIHILNKNVGNFVEICVATYQIGGSTNKSNQSAVRADTRIKRLSIHFVARRIDIDSFYRSIRCIFDEDVEEVVVVRLILDQVARKACKCNVPTVVAYA